MRPCCTLGVRARRIHSGAPALALRATADGMAGTWGTACSGSLRCERTYAATLAAECGVVASGVGRRRASPGLAGEKCSETYAVLPRAAGKRLHGRVSSDRTPVAHRASRERRRNTSAHGRVSVAKLRPCSAVGRGLLRRRACAALQRHGDQHQPTRACRRCVPEVDTSLVDGPCHVQAFRKGSPTLTALARRVRVSGGV